MTQGFPAQAQYAQQPQQFAPPQGYAPPAQPQYTPPVQQAGGFTVPAPVPQYQQGMGLAPGNFFTQQDPHIQTANGGDHFVGTNQQHEQRSAPQQTDTTGFWGGAPSLSFDAQKGYVKGTFRGGQVLSKTISNQTDMANGQVRTWDDGTPRKQMVLLLQTSERADPQDNGQRQLFIKGDLPRACREAFQAAGASDIEIGSWVYAAWVDDKPAKKPGFNPSKIYKVTYARPGQPDPMPAPVQVAAPAMAQPQYAQQPQQFAAPGPIAQMPQQQAAAMNGMWQAAPSAEPQTFGQPGQMPPEQPQQFAAPQQVPADQAAQFAAWQAQQAAQQPQPGGQPSAPGYPPQPQQAAPQGQQPPQWSPFA